MSKRKNSNTHLESIAEIVKLFAGNSHIEFKFKLDIVLLVLIVILYIFVDH